MKKLKKVGLLLGFTACLIAGANSAQALTVETQPQTTITTTDLDGIDTDNVQKETPPNPGEYLKDVSVITDEDMVEAHKWAEPITGWLGVVIGAGMLLLVAFFFLQTIIDMIYVSLPFSRTVLTGGKHQFVSDEATRVSKPAQKSGVMSGLGSSPMAFDMNPSSSFGEEKKTKNALGDYFKSRVFTLVILGIAVTILLSSALLGTGINLGQWLLRLLESANEIIKGA